MRSINLHILIEVVDPLMAINILIYNICLSINEVKSSKGKLIIFSINEVKWKKLIFIRTRAKKGKLNAKNNKK